MLTYQLKREVSGGNASIVAAASGTYHAVSVAKATTAGYAKGIWHWQAYVDNGTSRYLVDRGTFNILPDFAVAGDLDNRVKTLNDLLQDRKIILNDKLNDEIHLSRSAAIEPGMCRVELWHMD